MVFLAPAKTRRSTMVTCAITSPADQAPEPGDSRQRSAGIRSDTATSFDRELFR
jgi:hypothetical protein